MRRLQLSMGFYRNPRVAALLDGKVDVQGVDLIVNELHPSELDWRQFSFQQFDVAETSISFYTQARLRGIDIGTAIPVFSNRGFYHTGVLVREGAGIEEPADLRGKRVGVPEYHGTIGAWVRGALEHEFGVEAREMAWFQERSSSQSVRGALDLAAPEGVSIEHIPEPESLGSWLVGGQLDAVLIYLRARSRIIREGPDLERTEGIRPLFDRVQESHRYYKQTGLFPINHLVTVRRTLVDANPWLPIALYNAFDESKRIANAQLSEFMTPYISTGLGSLVDRDLFPYGIQRNQLDLETLMSYLAEQGILKEKPGLDMLFDPSTMGL